MPGSLERVRAARDVVRAARDELERAQRDYRAAVVHARDAGHTLAQIAETAGVSLPAVYKALAKGDMPSQKDEA